MEVEVVPSQPSRFVLIGSETGSPIYYDHKDGLTNCLVGGGFFFLC